MGSAFIVKTPVSAEPISVPDFKDWANIDFGDKDTVIARLISRARSYAETVTGRAWATQTIQQIFTIERPAGGELSGPFNRGPSWYQYQEQLGANPFGAAQFYFDLAMPPVQGDESTITVETRITAFQNWTAFPLITNADGTKNLWLNTTFEPARLFFQSPVTANFWRFTYIAGYSASYPLPRDYEQCLFEMVAFLFDNREGEDFPKSITNKLLSKRVSWVGLGAV